MPVNEWTNCRTLGRAEPPYNTPLKTLEILLAPPVQIIEYRVIQKLNSYDPR
jgi:hypothetical protein